MPISPSPIVQGYMGGGPEQGAPMSADQMFEKSFADEAFNNLRAKFPQLLNNIVTFKILDANVKDGKAFGTFVLGSGNTIRYIPIVMTQGAVTSCEMLYDKEADTFEPLSSNSVQNFLNQAMFHGGEVMSGDAHVEDTRQLMRSMIRPPASSNVILAFANSKVASLPNAAKEAVRAWLNDNHDTLAKIATVYDITVLSDRLSLTKEAACCGHGGSEGKGGCSADKKKPKVLELKNISKEMVKSLTEEERRILQKEGYLVKSASEGTDTIVTPDIDLKAAIETELSMEMYTYDNEYTEQPRTVDRTVRRANGVTYVNGKVILKPAIVMPHCIFFDKDSFWIQELRGSMLLKDVSEDVLEVDLRAAGAFDANELVANIEKYSDRCLIPVFRMKNGRWRTVESKHWLSIRAESKFTKLDKDIFIYAQYSGDTEYHITPSIQHGCVYADNVLHLPKHTLFFAGKNYGYSSLPCGLMRSLDEFRRLVMQHGTPLRVVGDGISYDITDGKTNKTAKLHSKIAAVRYLADTFDLNHDQVATVLDNHNTVIFNKYAFYQPQMNPNTGMQMPAAPAQYMPVQQAQAQQMPAQLMQPTPMPPVPQGQPVMGMTQPQALQPVFDPSAMQYAADIGDPNVIDTGILASFAQDPDMKALLVDYLPDFENMLDRIGRVILLFSLEKEDLENAYGQDRYSSVLGSCRKMFKLLGETTDSLKRYVHMV